MGGKSKPECPASHCEFPGVLLFSPFISWLPSKVGHIWKLQQIRHQNTNKSHLYVHRTRKGAPCGMETARGIPTFSPGCELHVTVVQSPKTLRNIPLCRRRKWKWGSLCADVLKCRCYLYSGMASVTKLPDQIITAEKVVYYSFQKERHVPTTYRAMRAQEVSCRQRAFTMFFEERNR